MISGAFWSSLLLLNVSLMPPSKDKRSDRGQQEKQGRPDEFVMRSRHIFVFQVHQLYELIPPEEDPGHDEKNENEDQHVKGHRCSPGFNVFAFDAHNEHFHYIHTYQLPFKRMGRVRTPCIDEEAGPDREVWLCL